MRVLLVLVLGLAHSFAQQVETPSGKLVGSVSEHGDSISVFKGIPYALAPTGARRWTCRSAPWLARRAQRHTFQSGLYTAPLSRGLVFRYRLILPAKIACTSTFGRLCQRLNRCR